MQDLFDKSPSKNYRTERTYRTEQREYADDEYLLSEIARLKAEAEEIRQILNDRQIRMDELEKSSNKAILKVADTLNKLSEQIEDVEAAITETVENNQQVLQETIQDEVVRANKPLEDRYKKLEEELQENLDSLKIEIAASSDKIGEVKTTVEGLDEVLEEKADKRAVIGLHQRFTTMFAVGVVDLVGTIMTLALLCYLIISVAR